MKTRPDRVHVLADSPSDQSPRWASPPPRPPRGAATLLLPTTNDTQSWRSVIVGDKKQKNTPHESTVRYSTPLSPAKRLPVTLRGRSASRSTASPVASSSTLNHSPPRPQVLSIFRFKFGNNTSDIFPLDSTPSLPSPPPLAVPATAEWDFEAHPAGPPASCTTVFQCTEEGCTKSYKGKNARSIWKRHLADKHGIGLSSQKKRTRWDSDSCKHSRPKDDKERRERTLESKRKWARKMRQGLKMESVTTVNADVSNSVMSLAS